MSYLIGFHGAWLLIATILGVIIGWLTYQPIRARWMDGLVWLVVALVALGAIVAIAMLIPGRPGYWLELAVLMSLAYGIGCPIGWTLRHFVSVGGASVDQDDIVVPKPGYVFPGGTLDDFGAARATSSPDTTASSSAGEHVPPAASSELSPGSDAVPATPSDSLPVSSVAPVVSSGSEQGSPTSAQRPEPAALPVAIISDAGEAAGGGTITPPPESRLVAGSETLPATPPVIPPSPPETIPAVTGSDSPVSSGGVTGGSDVTTPHEEPETKPPVSAGSPSPTMVPQQAVPVGLAAIERRDGGETGTSAPSALATTLGPIVVPVPTPDDQVPAVAVPVGGGPQKMSPLADEDRHAGLRPDGWIAARDNRADDLQRIKGIGPQNEGRLHGLGIWHFDQIAAWTPDNVLWVGSYLAFHGRIDREKWVDQAKALAIGAAPLVSKRGSGEGPKHAPVVKPRGKR